jgi:hypothetical protein
MSIDVDHLVWRYQEFPAGYEEKASVHETNPLVFSRSLCVSDFIDNKYGHIIGGFWNPKWRGVRGRQERHECIPNELCPHNTPIEAPNSQ